MKQEYDFLVCVAGWEERFVEGVKTDINDFMVGSLIMWRFEEFNSQTNPHVTEVLNHAWFHDIEAEERVLRRQPQAVWLGLREVYADPKWSNKRVLLDITTMPREVIWWTLAFLRDASCSVDYVYYHPKAYATDWLTRDTALPRLVYQHSGVAKLGKPTALLLLNGFDNERAAQLIQFFEPSMLIVGTQAGKQFDNESKNLEQAQMFHRTMKNVLMFEVDAFSTDAGYRAIESSLYSVMDSYNVVAASLGPKTSAIALFRLISKYPALALAYAPSRQFNPAYSTGVGERLSGHVSFV
jgi:hypothetical protein